MPHDLLVSQSCVKYEDLSHWEWSLTEHVVNAFVNGSFDNLRLVHPFSYSAYVSPYAFFNVQVHLRRIMFGDERADIMLHLIETSIARYFLQLPATDSYHAIDAMRRLFAPLMYRLGSLRLDFW